MFSKETVTRLTLIPGNHMHGDRKTRGGIRKQDAQTDGSVCVCVCVEGGKWIR
jgi:hypothetical protein